MAMENINSFQKPTTESNLFDTGQTLNGSNSNVDKIDGLYNFPNVYIPWCSKHTQI